MIYEPIPYNSCRICHAFKPWNEVNFVKSKRDGITRECRECRKQYRDEHKIEACRRAHEWRQRNPEREKANKEKQKVDPHAQAIKKAYQREYYQANRASFAAKNAAWQRQNPDKVAKAHRRYNETHPEVRRRIKQSRLTYARSLPSTFTGQDWRSALVYFHGCCAYCGNPPSLFDTYTVLHEEHFIAQINGGGYTPDNILPACQSCNLSKGERDPREWCIERFGKRKAREILARIEQYFEEFRAPVVSHS